jgi:hypothetical protein
VVVPVSTPPVVEAVVLAAAEVMAAAQAPVLQAKEIVEAQLFLVFLDITRLVAVAVQYRLAEMDI